MADNFSISKDSIQLPYRRFLADSAAGLSLLVIAIATYYLPIISDAPLREAWIKFTAGRMATGVGAEMKVLIALLLFLLATPIGFAANALSWLLIDYSICTAERKYFKWFRKNGRVFPLWDVTEARFGHVLDQYFDLRPENFNTSGWFFRDVLEAYVPDRFETQTHIKGLVVFLRNLTLFSLILMFVTLWNGVAGRFASGAVVLGAVGLTFLLTIRWKNSLDEKDKKMPVVHWVVAFLTAAAIGIAAYQAGALGARAIIMFTVAAGAVVIIGMVEYYYHDAILLHAYLACREYSIVEPAAGTKDRVLRIAEELIQRIAEREVELKKK